MIQPTLGEVAVIILLTTLALAGPTPKPTIDLDMGHSVVLELPAAPVIVRVTDTHVAQAQRLGESNTILLQGRALGETDLVVTYGEGRPLLHVDLNVHRNLSAARRLIADLSDTEPDVQWTVVPARPVTARPVTAPPSP
ncbi:MAG: Flp pilus assembly secretin CpaC [Myxococcota bacterium]